MGRKIDKRTIMTRRAIKRALTDTLYDTPLNKISVTDIASLCNINRNTFYIHYSSIEEAIKDIENDLKKYVLGELRKFTIQEFLVSPKLFTSAISAALLNNESKEKLFFRSTISEMLLSQLSHDLVDYLILLYREETDAPDPCCCYSFEFLVSGFIYSLVHWYHSDRSVRLEQCLERINALAEHGVGETFRIVPKRTEIKAR